MRNRFSPFWERTHITAGGRQRRHSEANNAPTKATPSKKGTRRRRCRAGRAAPGRAEALPKPGRSGKAPPRHTDRPGDGGAQEGFEQQIGMPASGRDEFRLGSSRRRAPGICHTSGPGRRKTVRIPSASRRRLGGARQKCWLWHWRRQSRPAPQLWPRPGIRRRFRGGNLPERRTNSDGHDDHGEAGYEQGHGNKSGEVAGECRHGYLLFFRYVSSMFLFCSVVNSCIGAFRQFRYSSPAPALWSRSIRHRPRRSPIEACRPDGPMDRR
ncbi:hypothetical protein DFR52_101983 [Hoeflea marina]|uniref:Uncharacterized protein n=1 Tax=Hoeflea marina TaxID=274592 RepID=A0A317PS45_9HYPH|nr:hypothetical protein DFR52_101983 [Hoeflea marina]